MFPYTLASEISFFHASRALSDLSRTAYMSSTMPNRHLVRLGWTYGHGKYKWSDGEKHVGLERMSLIMGSKEAVVTTSPSPTTPGMTVMVRTVAVGEDVFDLVV